jgi:hypothetical protein
VLDLLDLLALPVCTKVQILGQEDKKKGRLLCSSADAAERFSSSICTVCTKVQILLYKSTNTAREALGVCSALL